jgi:hypothetical protein
MAKKLKILLLSGVLCMAALAWGCAKPPPGPEPETDPYQSYYKVYVDAAAAEGGDGGAAAPFRTVAEAQGRARELQAAGIDGKPGINIELKEGRYEISEPLAVTPADNGP